MDEQDIKVSCQGGQQDTFPAYYVKTGCNIEHGNRMGALLHSQLSFGNCCNLVTVWPNCLRCRGKGKCVWVNKGWRGLTMFWVCEQCKFVPTKPSMCEHLREKQTCKTERVFVRSLCECVHMSYNPWGLREVCTHSVLSCCFPLIPPVYTGNEPLLALTLPASSLLQLLPCSKSPDVGLLNTQRDQAAHFCCTPLLHRTVCSQPQLHVSLFEWIGWAYLFKSTFEWPFHWNT